MKISKFKKVGKNKSKVMFGSSGITLYEDVILKYDLLLIKEIDIDLLDKIIEENKYYDAYYSALNYIEIKTRYKKEIISYLKKKDFSESLINSVIEKLESLNLLNNKNYISAYTNDRINLSNDGPYKIKKTLLDYEFNESDIDEYLNTIDNYVWIEKLNKIVNKKQNLMKNKSYYMFISKMKNDLYNLGYDRDMIEEVLSKIEYNSNAIEKDFEKAKKKFKNDKNKIISSLLRKGYNYDEINSFFKN